MNNPTSATYTLSDHEVELAVPSHLVAYLDVQIGHATHEIRATMDVDDDGCGDTIYKCDTLVVESGSELEAWLGERIDELYEEYTDQDDD